MAGGTRVILPRTSSVSVASVGFMALAESTRLTDIFLADITVPSYGANPSVVLRLSDREFTDPDGNRYHPFILEKSGIDYAGEFLENTWQPADMDLICADLRFGFQPLGQSFSTLLYQYELVGATVLARLGAPNMATSEFRTIFEGEIAKTPDSDPVEIHLRCVQARAWVRPFPPRTIERNLYPNAPQDSIGIPIPVVYGFHGNRRWLLDLPTGLDKPAYWAGIARGACPLIPADSGAAGSAPLYIRCEANGSSISDILMVDSSSSRLMGTQQATSVTDANGVDTIILSGTNYSQFKLFIPAIINGSLNTSLNWQECSRDEKGYDLAGYTTLDHGAGQRIFHAQLPDLSSLGTLISATAVIWYAKNASVTNHPTFGVRDGAGSFDLTTLSSAASSTFPSNTPIQFASRVIATQLSTWAGFVQNALYAEVGEAGSKLHIHRFGILVTFIPNTSVVRSGGSYQQPVYREGMYGTIWITVNNPEERKFNAPTFSYPGGPFDDGSGTYTGSAGAGIEHPADIVRHILVNRGGLSPSTGFVTAASTFGSFTDIRSLLSGYKALLFQSNKADVEQIVQKIGEQFLIWFYRRAHATGSPWVAVPWMTGLSQNYRSPTNQFVFTKRYIEAVPRAPRSDVSRVRNVVRVNYDYDVRLGTYAQQCFISDTDSRGWNGSSEFRDEAANREVSAADSIARYGRRELVHNLMFCKDAATATSVRNRLFDWLYRPRVTVEFSSFLNAFDLERGMVIQLSEELDSVLHYPGPGSDGSWYGKNLVVESVARNEAGAVTYEIKAVEV
jgi:hypothetical protein